MPRRGVLTRPAAAAAAKAKATPTRRPAAAAKAKAKSRRRLNPMLRAAEEIRRRSTSVLAVDVAGQQGQQRQPGPQPPSKRSYSRDAQNDETLNLFKDFCSMEVAFAKMMEAPSEDVLCQSMLDFKDRYEPFQDGFIKLIGRIHYHTWQTYQRRERDALRSQRHAPVDPSMAVLSSQPRPCVANATPEKNDLDEAGGLEFTGIRSKHAYTPLTRINQKSAIFRNVSPEEKERSEAIFAQMAATAADDCSKLSNRLKCKDCLLKVGLTALACSTQRDLVWLYVRTDCKHLFA